MTQPEQKDERRTWNRPEMRNDDTRGEQ